MKDLDLEIELWTRWRESLGVNEPDWPRVNPFSRYDWTGSIYSIDGTDDSEVSEDSCLFLLVAGSTPSGWDGEASGIALLKDGRWIAWCESWGPTGDGFNRDAYGGNGTIYVGRNPESLRAQALGSEGRFLCGIPFAFELPVKDE